MKSNAGSLITQIKQISGRIFESILAEKKIEAFNGAQGHILYTLWQEDKISLKEISDKTGLATTTLTSMVDRMEKQGLVKRKNDKNDRRKISLHLTEKAKNLKKDYDEVSDKMFDIFYKNFNTDEIELFEKLLNKVLDNLKGI